jgi:hypothetical protein
MATVIKHGWYVEPVGIYFEKYADALAAAETAAENSDGGYPPQVISQVTRVEHI